MKFVGIVIAWSERNPSGVAVIDSDGTLTHATGNLRTNDSLLEFAALNDGEGAVVTIDAPLIVKNADKQRPVERELTSIFGAYEAGAYPANLSNSAFQAGGRIRRLVQRLEGMGFKHEPQPRQQSPQRTFLEVFPSPAQVILFPCMTHSGHTHCRPPPYKYKPKRTWIETQCEWEMYRARLLSLRAREPALKFSPDVKQMLTVDVEDHRGVRYKVLDDLLDGIFCAYLAHYFWYWGNERSCVVGDMNNGYVTLPRCKLSNCPLDSDSAKRILRELSGEV